MTPQSTVNHNDNHQDVWELLPWYANGTLDTSEHALVEAHLVNCLACQSELARCRDLSRKVKVSGEGAWAPSAKHFAQVLATVDAADAPRRAPARGETWLEKLRSWFAHTPGPMQWAFAAQGALVVALASALLLQPGPRLYETYSRDSSRSSTGNVAMYISFAENITEKELREVLQDMHGNIVQGPLPNGVYAVELPVAETAPRDPEQVLKTVRANPKVRFAELVPGNASQ